MTKQCNTKEEREIKLLQVIKCMGDAICNLNSGYHLTAKAMIDKAQGILKELKKQ